MQIVPQFIDIEDKVAGPFTWRQLGWISGGGFILFILWKTLDKSGFFVFAIPIVTLVAAFAFYRPNGTSFVRFIVYSIGYFFKPHIYTWQREIQADLPLPKNPHSADDRISKKALTEDDILTLTEAVDSHGAIRNDRLDELIKANLPKSRS